MFIFVEARSLTDEHDFRVRRSLAGNSLLARVIQGTFLANGYFFRDLGKDFFGAHAASRQSNFSKFISNGIFIIVLVIPWTDSRNFKAIFLIHGLRGSIPGTHFQESPPCSFILNCLQGVQQDLLANALPAEIRVDGDGGDMGFVDDEPQHQHGGNSSIHFGNPAAAKPGSRSTSKRKERSGQGKLNESMSISWTAGTSSNVIRRISGGHAGRPPATCK